MRSKGPRECIRLFRRRISGYLGIIILFREVEGGYIAILLVWIGNLGRYSKEIEKRAFSGGH